MSNARYLGIDIGGTKVSLRAVRGPAFSEDEVFWHSVTQWPSSPVSVAEDLAILREQIGQLRSKTQQPFAGVGVAVAATMTPAGRVTAWPNRPMWKGTDLLAELHTLVPEARITWDDDGALAAVAEAQAAAVPDLVYIGIGTGIGGGIMVKGRPLSAGLHGSSELGHLMVNHGGALCNCGRQGCLQAESSGPATLRRASAAHGEMVSFDELLTGWVTRKPWATRAVEHSCAVLAAALAGVGELVHPTAHIVGGGFAAGIPGFVDEVARQAAVLSRPGHPVAPILAAKFGGQSSLHGAILAARKAG